MMDENDALIEGTEEIYEECSAEPDAGRKKGRAGRIVRELALWAWPSVAAVFLAVFIKQTVLMNANVPSGSMENTIMTGDSIIGSRIAYTFSDPERGDIVIFRYPDDETQTYIKRIIGLPGETVVIKEGKIYIDGAEEPLDEGYLPEEWTIEADGYTFEVPEGCYLMLGDNRNSSWDARYWETTFVKREDILAKALFSYWPASDAAWLGGYDY